MDNFYKINLPNGMAPVHPDLLSSAIPSLAAPDAGRVFVSGISFIKNMRIMPGIRLFDAPQQHIFQFNPGINQKKEVHDIKNELQHCKSIQYNTKWSSGPDFFNNTLFIY
jgi:hypothetical protein